MQHLSEHLHLVIHNVDWFYEKNSIIWTRKYKMLTNTSPGDNQRALNGSINLG